MTNVFFNVPLLPFLGATFGIAIYWFLRVRATKSASYHALSSEVGAPGRLERRLLGVLVVVCCLLLIYRGVLALL